MKNDIYEKYKAKYENRILDGRYLIDRLTGVGGMAVVFRGRDTSLNNMPVAIKILKDDVATDETVVKRFKIESRAGLDLRHNNIVAVHDVSTDKKIKYMVMEYLHGMTLKSYLATNLAANNKSLNPDEIVRYTAQILRALSEAHRNGIIHRDIKPQNIMVLENGRIKVMDFGIAKLPDAETLTMTDKAVGTVYYMSPEQARGDKDIDTRSDIYSLGAMMYELATGETPFKGDSQIAILVKHMQEEPVPPRQINPSIPVGLEQIILHAMNKNPDDRFQSANEMLSYVKQLQANKKIKFDNLRSSSSFKAFLARIKNAFVKKKKKEEK